MAEKKPYTGKRFVSCRGCASTGGPMIDKEVQEEGKDYIRTGKATYYHMDCYEKKSSPSIGSSMEDQLWEDSTFDYLFKILKMPVNYPKFNNQWISYLKKKMTAKGIYYTVRYMYDIKHMNVEKAEGGIGLVPSLYAESSSYWIKLGMENIPADIKKQQEDIENRKKVLIERREQSKSKTKWSLDLEEE